MSKHITIKGWQVEFDWRGLTLTPPEQVDRYREIKSAAREAQESWLQAADAFVPGGLLLADVPLRRQKYKKTVRRRVRRRRLS